MPFPLDALIMGAHEMLNVGSTVTGTVDGSSYLPQYLCDNDPGEPIKTPDGSASFLITGAAAITGIDGMVVVNSNLDAGIVVTFSGLGTVTMPAVRKNGIRYNGYTRLATPAGSVGSTTLSLAGNSNDVVIGEGVVGIFRSINAMPPGPTYSVHGFGIPHPGEFGGPAYSKGGRARRYGGTVLVDDATKAILDACEEASRENSLPTILVPKPSLNDAWYVIWESYETSPLEPNLWAVSVTWLELTNFEWNL